MINKKQKIDEFGLIVEGLLVVIGFFFISITILFFLNKQVDFSLKDRQINFDYERAGLYTELPVMVLTADGNPILKTESRINELFRTYSEIASRNSIVGYPLCMFLVESEFLNGNVQLTRFSNYEYDCGSYLSGIPDCGREGVRNLHNINGESKQYFIVSFYLKDGNLINNKCAVARGTYKEILEPPFTLPTYVPPTITPTINPTIVPTEKPTIEPTTSPTVMPTIEPTIEPTSRPTLEPTISPPVEPTKRPTLEPSVRPTVKPTLEPTVVPTKRPTLEPTVRPTLRPTVVPTKVPPTIEPTKEPTAKPTIVPTTTPDIEPSIIPTRIPTKPTPVASESVEPTREVLPNPSEVSSEKPLPEKSDRPNFGFRDSRND